MYATSVLLRNNPVADVLTGMERGKVLTVASELLKTSEFSEDPKLLNFHIFANMFLFVQQVRVRTSDLFYF